MIKIGTSVAVASANAAAEPRRRWPPGSLPVLVAFGVSVALALGGCGSSSGSGSGSGGGSGSSGGSGGSSSSSTAAKVLAPATKTSCVRVNYIGDSTSDGEANPEYVPDKALRAPTQLKRVGVKHVHMQVSGARSIVETFENFPNAATVARGDIQGGYHGCWIMAMGTNDTADIAAGSTVGMNARIHEIMSIVRGQPVMWINVLTIAGSPEYYGESGMAKWDRTLLAACRRYPNMRVLDWAALAQHKWFIPDGVHYTTLGYEHRTKIIAHGLVRAFPLNRPAPSNCLVR